MGYNIYPVTTETVRRFVSCKYQLQICTLHTHALLFSRFELCFSAIQTNFAYIAQGMLTKMQLISSYCTFLKHRFKSKLKHTFITGIPGQSASHEFELECGSSLPQSKTGCGVHQLYAIHCFLKAVPNSYWKHTRRLATGISTIRAGCFLFSKERKPHLQCMLAQSVKTWKLLSPQLPSSQKQFVFSTHHTQHQQEHHIRISNHPW